MLYVCRKIDCDRPAPGARALLKRRIFAGHDLPLFDGQQHVLPGAKLHGRDQALLAEHLSAAPQQKFAKPNRSDRVLARQQRCALFIKLHDWHGYFLGRFSAVDN